MIGTERVKFHNKTKKITHNRQSDRKAGWAQPKTSTRLQQRMEASGAKNGSLRKGSSLSIEAWFTILQLTRGPEDPEALI